MIDSSWQILRPTFPPSHNQIIAILSVALLYLFTTAIYGLYFSPLSAYPGNKLWSISNIPRIYHSLNGTIAHKLLQLHNEYGPVVRTGTNWLSYSTPDAWSDIYTTVRPQLRKTEFPAPPNGVRGLAMCASDVDHARMRRNLAQGVTEKALREQEPILKEYFDAFIAKIEENCSNGPIDLSLYFNLVTVDVIGDLIYGESFQCLEQSALHTWVVGMFNVVKVYVLVGILLEYPPFDRFFLFIGRLFAKKLETQHREFSRTKVRNRLEIKGARPDLVAQAQRNLSTPDGMSVEELVDTCVQMTLAGSETTATLLTATVWYLLKNPTCLTLLTHEIRSTFAEEKDITFDSVKNCPYLLAVLEEGLRIFPPVPNQQARITHPTEGNVISGKYVPPNTRLGVSHFACYRSEENFHDPETFAPERWLQSDRPTYLDSESPYKNDRLSALQPFSLGPRNCIGAHLARAEMRVLLARLVWKFDLSFPEDEVGQEMEQWGDGMRVFMIWQRGALMVKVMPRSEWVKWQE
jgi:cytochrome P450